MTDLLPESLRNRDTTKIVHANEGYTKNLDLKTYDRVLILSSPIHFKSGAVHKLIGELNPIYSKVICDIAPNPTSKEISRVIRESQPTNFSVIIALGGGSVIDTAKIVSMFSNQVELDPKLYLFNPEFEFKNIRTCKLIAIPTTAGTGSEVTQFATIWDDVAKRKHSLLSSHMYPDLAILDPELLEQLPFDLALYSCLDATAHCMETLWNKNRTSESESLAKSGLQIIDKNLFAFSKRIWNKEIAGQLQIAAVFGGLAISISRTAISHSISYPLTSRLSIPHGLAVGFTLAAIYESLDGDEIEFDEGRRLLESVVRQLKEIDLSQHIMRYASITQILDLVDEMSASDRAKNFVKSIDRQLLISILEKSLHS